MQRFPGMILTEQRAQQLLEDGTWTQESYIDVLERDAREYPDFVHKDERRSLTYAQMWSEVESFASALYQMGVRKGDRVALQLANSLDYVVAVFGAARIGAVAVLLQTDLGREALDFSLRKAQARVWVVADSFRGEPLYETARSLQQAIPAIEHVILQREEGTAQAAEDPATFTELCSAPASVASHLLNEQRPGPLDPFVMVFTSGTTGSPKGVVQLHANYLWSCRAYAKLYGQQTGEATLNMAPICHQTGMLVGVMMPVAIGGRILLLERFASGRVLRWIERERPTYLCGAPPHVIHMANADGLKAADTSSVRLFFYAGAPVPASVLRRLQNDTGIRVGGMFGWTEGFVACATRPDDPIEAISQTVGQAVPGIEIRLMDEGGQVVPAGAPGEMWSRGPNFSAGYYDHPEAAARQWDADGWFHSGDLFRQDESGRFMFMGRADDIINRGGTKIDPKSVEDACAAHPAVENVSVVGEPDDTLGQRTVACIVLKEGASEFSVAELRAFLANSGLARFQFPDRVVFLDGLPMTHSGKIKKKSLREQLQHRTEREHA